MLLANTVCQVCSLCRVKKEEKKTLENCTHVAVAILHACVLKIIDHAITEF